MSKKSKKKTVITGKKNKKQKEEPIHLESKRDTNLLVEEQVKLLTNGAIKRLISAGYRPKQVKEYRKIIEGICRDLLNEKVSEDKVGELLARRVLIPIVSERKLFTKKEIEYIAQLGEEATMKIVKSLGMAKRELKATISLYVDEKLVPAGFIKDKTVNQLFSLIRDNWDVENLDAQIAEKISAIAIESYQFNKQEELKMFMDDGGGVKLTKILEYREAASNMLRKDDEDKLIDEAKTTLRRTNPELEEKVDITAKPESISGNEPLRAVRIGRTLSAAKSFKASVVEAKDELAKLRALGKLG